MKNLALVDPNLYADTAVSGLSLNQTVVNVCTDGLQRDRTLFVCLGTRDLGAAYTAADLDLDTTSAKRMVLRIAPFTARRKATRRSS